MPWKPTAATTQSVKSGKSIRGHISGPFPLQHANDEFPMRDPGASFALPLDSKSADLHVEQKILDSVHQHRPPPGSFTRSYRATRLWNTGAQPAGAADKPPSPGTSRSTLTAMHPLARGMGELRTAQQPPESDDARPLSTLPQATEEEAPKRRKSSFKAALSKLFGRKKHTTSVLLSNSPPRKSTPTAVSMQHHQSYPAVDKRPLRPLNSKRLASLPVTEFDRALRSHSVGPDDVLAIQSARNSLSPDMTLSPRRLGPGTPPTVHLEEPSDIGHQKAPSFSLRPATSFDQLIRAAEYSEDPSEIGRAITSDKGLRRRSKSLSAFATIEQSSQSVRRRSDEIRHWRESYGPSVLSNDQSDPLKAPDHPDLTAPVIHHDESDDALAGLIMDESLRPFVFVDADSFDVESQNKENQAPDCEPPAPTDLGSRVHALESRMSRLEELVSHLVSPAPAFCNTLDPSNRNPPRQPQPWTGLTTNPLRLSCQMDMDDARLSHRTLTSYPSNPLRRSIGAATSPHLDMAPKMARQGVPASADHSMPTHTINTSNRTSLDTSRPGVGDVDSEDGRLMALLTSERSARLTLESQVVRLSRQVEFMTKLADIAQPTRNGTPTTERPATRRSMHCHGERAAAHLARTNGRRKSRSTITRGSSAGRDSAHALQDTDETAESPVTPDEDDQDFDVYEDYGDEEEGDEEEEEEEAIMAAAKALSLSRITLSKPPTAINHVPPPPPQALT